jgi:YVTN family beta-propeller protein
LLKVFTFLFAALYVLTLTGCDRDTIIIPEIPVNTSEGAYVLSEGLIPGSGILSFYNVTVDSFYNNIMNAPLIYPDGLFISGNDLFVVEQGNFGSSGNIFLCDTNGNINNSASAGTNPYSLTIANNKIYLTNGPAGSVSVLNKVDFSFVTNISVGLYPQEKISIGNKIFVCNTGLFAGPKDSTVSVIDALTDQVIFTIRVRYDPSSLEITNDGKLLVSCPGPGINPQGIIYKIDPDNYNKLDSFIISDGVDKDLSVDNESNFVYFISGNNNIVRLDLVSKANGMFIPNSNPASVFYYGYKYASKNRKHYLADASSFVVNGKLLVYNGSGNLEKSFTTGLAPRRIALKLN